ncbi:ABC transporter permease [Bradyrhizobium canariense]|uniref:ABC transporter permease n=1 Tax=Bradyrhizobium TaxID=374 RepID=UPI000A199C51|nr:ABC transporter permease [Bradyrhizobium canariense]OSI30560.1 polyamine ABC transporter permease [Bradyrhizobium canariense]OSI37321.1 polyamine ABC transporter permease [Bradyrhizobium canariense]OSI52040.1 polyamine ABC transporter permease [Bradyrhizobium canariense]OSI56344.1 polyamine ABC transporter permease [Bradyrhizobium canariense]OSI59415.1 polyamine ABC transporter permease [Bradyrhizobium canariense]
MAASAYASPMEKTWYCLHRMLCAMVLLFLIAPIFVVVPLSFNSVPFFTYPLPRLSLRWYQDFFLTVRWQGALYNSIFVAVSVTLLSTVLGTLAALGLSRPKFPWRTAVMTVLISPIIVPIVITAVGMYFFYADVGLLNSYAGLVLAHTTLATPFVVITVLATLTGFDHSLTRAAAGLGATPVTAFLKVTLPLILPGMISGSLFAFLTSFDEVVVTLFVAGAEQRTLPKVMFSGIREEISPTIIAAATILTLFSIVVLTTIELLRWRSERLRGIRNT